MSRTKKASSVPLGRQDVDWPAAWPIPTIRGGNLAPYTEPKNRAHSLPDLLATTFSDFKLRCAFGELVLNCGDMIESVDRKTLCPSDVPSPTAHRRTKGIYGADEVAAWWNAAREIVEKWRIVNGLPVDK
jgi:hypothetical protein